MDNSRGEERTLGDELFDAGWRQGTLFNAPSACFTWNAFSPSGSSELVISPPRRAKSKEKFVLITQDCDIVEKESVEPYIEGLLCKQESSRFLGSITPKSARWFVINPFMGLVAHAKYRVQFAKQVFSQLTPEPWPRGSNQLDEFVRWLARRYDRPSIPDAIYEAFQRPLDERIKLFSEEYPEEFAAFNRVVGDVRVKLSASEKPPFDLQLILVIRTEGLSEQEADAIRIFDEMVSASINPDLVHLNRDLRVMTEEEISMAEYYASRPIYLYQHTYKGEEIEGARPFERD